MLCSKGAVAVASLGLETGAVQDDDPTASPMKQASLLHASHCGRDARSADAEGAPEELMS
nr:hypothetical protein [Microvirga arabica]